jgi:hypothetical protein
MYTRILQYAFMIIVLLGLFFSECIKAQEIPHEMNKPADKSSVKQLIVPEILPDEILKELEDIKSNDPKIINSNDAAQFKKVILPELYKYVEGDFITVSALSRLDYQWRYDDEWEKQSSLEQGKVSKDQALDKSGADSFRRFPHGRYRDIELLSEDKRSQAFIENLESLFSAQRYITAGLDFFWFEKGKLVKKGKSQFTRMYPKYILPHDKSIQYFRERVTFLDPLQINGHSFIMFRFLGDNEDLVWVYSSVLRKLRQLTGSNRGDGILGDGIAHDDIFTWSGKKELQIFSAPEKVKLLVPYIHSGELLLENTSEQCSQVKNVFESLQDTITKKRTTFTNTTIGKVEWDIQSFSYILRDLIKIQMTSLDPYSLHGRQVLYIDPESMLPLYKVVYDRAGRSSKLIYTIFGLASSNDNQRKIPVPFFTVAIDMRREVEQNTLKKSNMVGINNSMNEFPLSSAAVIQYSAYKTCDTLPEEYKHDLFDPMKIQQ